MAIRLVVDSSSDLPKEIIKKYNIVVAPLSVLFGDEEYFDGVDITATEFYTKLKSSSISPTTSQVTPEGFITKFRPILDNQDEVLCITIGSNASGTCQSAHLAKDELGTDKITIIDSNMLCMGTGYISILAAELITSGHTTMEIVEKLQPLTDNKIEHLFCVDTLEYLKRGGRLRASQAFIGEILNIKPVLNVKDAITQPIGKLRGRKKIIPFYLAHIEATIDFHANPFICIAHSNDEAFANEFMSAFKEKFKWEKPIYFSELGATIGAHTGEGVLAVFYIKK